MKTSSLVRSTLAGIDFHAGAAASVMPQSSSQGTAEATEENAGGRQLAIISHGGSSNVPPSVAASATNAVTEANGADARGEGRGTAGEGSVLIDLVMAMRGSTSLTGDPRRITCRSVVRRTSLQCVNALQAVWTFCTREHRR